jgi:cytochrome c oxidase subunit 3
MARTLHITAEPPVVEVEVRRGGGGPGGGEPGGWSGDSRGGGFTGGVPQRAYVTGMTMGVAAILMFFMALVSAFIVRKGLSTDWQAFTLPPVLYVNTLLLLASSVTIQAARRKLAYEDLEGFRHWWLMTTALGLLFVGGQLLAWRQLAHAGVYLSSNPSSSFFYVLTAAHGVHLLGGIIALVAIAFWNWKKAHVARSTATEMATIYWHFMDGLWIFLFLLLKLGQ